MNDSAIHKGTDLYKILVDNGKNSDLILQKLADILPSIIYIYNVEDKKTTFLNDRFTTLLGYSADELKAFNNDLFSLTTGENKEKIKEIISNFLQQQTTEGLEFYSYLLHKDGTPCFFKSEGSVIDKTESGNPKNILFITRNFSQVPLANDAPFKKGSTFDITEQLKNHQDRQVFKQMMYENERLLGYGTWIYNFATQSIYWSDGMYVLFGYNPETDRNLLNVDSDIYSRHIDSQGLNTINEKRKLFLEKGINEFTWEYEILTQNNQDKKRIESYSRLVRDENGLPVQIVGTSRDITRLREYERSLEEKVKDLDRSNKDLEEFAYIASHDLQEPLRKLTTFSERLQQKFSDKLNDDGNTYIHRMLNATQNMRLLIDNLLEYSRTTSSSAHFENCDLNKLIKTALSDLELNIEESNTSIQIEDLPVIEGIPGQLSQLFINIIGNAIKFRIPGKTPEISIKSRLLKSNETSIHLLNHSRKYFKITITDNGIGFEEEYAKRIFQIFQRLHSKAEYPGTGIGLSICKKIVDNHKGIIYAKGKSLKGARFTIILPEQQ